MRKFLCLLCLFSLVGASPADALLENLLGEKKEAVAEKKTYPIQDEASFIAGTKSFHEIPFNNPRLEFDILLPKDWISEPLLTDASTNLGAKILTDIARFQSPLIGIHRASFTLQAVRLEHEGTAVAWLQNHISTNGYILQAPVVAENHRIAQAVFSYVDSAFLPVDSTIRAEINGNALVLARFDIPQPLKEELSFLRTRAMQSFRLTLTTDAPVEQQVPYTLSTAIKLGYPASWTIQKADTKDILRMAFDLHRLSSKQELLGLVRFAVIRRANYTTLQRELGFLKDFFQTGLKIHFTRLIETKEIPNVSSRFLFSRLESYETESQAAGKRGQEVHLAILGDAEWYVIAYLMTPPEQNARMTWAENVRAFDVILQSIR